VALFIAKKFKVSKYVAIRRALDLEILSQDIYWKTIAEWRKRDRRRKGKESAGGNYPATQVSYIGKRFVGLVMEALRRDYLTPIEVKGIVGLYPASIESYI